MARPNRIQEEESNRPILGIYMKYQKHPKYQAVRKPTADCSLCIRIWQDKQDPGASASVKLAESLRADPNVYTVGYTKGAPVIELVIYTVKKSKKEYPRNFEGFPVKVIKFGQISPLGSV